jgi:hypothetical protein
MADRSASRIMPVPVEGADRLDALEARLTSTARSRVAGSESTHEPPSAMPAVATTTEGRPRLCRSVLHNG